MSQIPVPLLRNVSSQADPAGRESNKLQGGVCPLQGGQAGCIQMFIHTFPQDELFFGFNMIQSMSAKGHSYQVLHHYITFQSAFMLLTSILNWFTNNYINLSRFMNWQFFFLNWHSTEIVLKNFVIVLSF